MIGTTILLGLRDSLQTCNVVDLTRYFILICILFVTTGKISEDYASKTKVFTLPRCNYAKWCRRVMIRSSVSILPIIMIACILALQFGADKMDVLTGGSALALNMLLLSMVQALLILWKGSSVGYGCLIGQQLLSLTLSNRLPGDWKLILPGNWGMYGRSNSITRGGFHMTAVLIIEAVLILALWTVGWRLLRWLIRRSK